MGELNSIIKAKFEYNITNAEQEMAYKAFQKKYVSKNNVIRTVIFALVFALFVQQVAANPDYKLGWIFSGVSFAFIIFIWYNPYKRRKSLMLALKELEDDKYEFELFEEFFSIKTLIAQEVIEEGNPENEEDSEFFEEIPPRIVYFQREPMDVIETDELFIIFLKRQTIYTLPKRCISEEYKKAIKEIFSENLNDGYEYKGEK